MKKILPMLLLLAGVSLNASAATFSAMSLLSQSQFKDLSEDFGAALSYKSLQPAEPLGITGFDVSLEATSTDISKSGAALKTATNGDVDITRVIVPKLHVSKGLPFGVDVSASLASVPGTDIKVIGGELRYAILGGGVALPAIAVRASMSRLSGVSEWDLNTKGLDLSISKGFLMFTPYAGIGQVWATSTPHAGTLTEENVTLAKTFIGANMNLGLMNFALEGDKTGDANSVSFKFGFRW